MKIASIQIKPVAGDIKININRHIEFIQIAAKEGADLIYFPELSITGYEPTMAKSLAMELSSPALDIFQELSDSHTLIIGVGLPLSEKGQTHIGMAWFEPNKPRSSYNKQLLHSDEEPFFDTGDKQLILEIGNLKLAPAICYESHQQSHSEKAVELGANVYLVSVAMSSSGVDKAMKHYSGTATAKKHKVFVILSNCIGPCDDFIGAGKSAAWDTNGKLLAQLDSDSQGMVILDTDSCNAVIHTNEIRNQNL